MSNDPVDRYPDRLLTTSERMEKARRHKSVYGGGRYHSKALKRTQEEKKPPDETWVKAKLRFGPDRSWVYFKGDEWDAMDANEHQKYLIARTDELNNRFQLRDKVSKSRRGTLVHSTLSGSKRY